MVVEKMIVYAVVLKNVCIYYDSMGYLVLFNINLVQLATTVSVAGIRYIVVGGVKCLKLSIYTDV